MLASWLEAVMLRAVTAVALAIVAPMTVVAQDLTPRTGETASPFEPGNAGAGEEQSGFPGLVPQNRYTPGMPRVWAPPSAGTVPQPTTEPVAPTQIVIVPPALNLGITAEPAPYAPLAIPLFRW